MVTRKTLPFEEEEGGARLGLESYVVHISRDLSQAQGNPRRILHR